MICGLFCTESVRWLNIVVKDYPSSSKINWKWTEVRLNVHTNMWENVFNWMNNLTTKSHEFTSEFIAYDTLSLMHSNVIKPPHVIQWAVNDNSKQWYQVTTIQQFCSLHFVLFDLCLALLVVQCSDGGGGWGGGYVSHVVLIWFSSQWRTLDAPLEFIIHVQPIFFRRGFCQDC